MANNTSMTDTNPFIEHSAEHNDLHGGDQWKFIFPNGYGASVVCHSHSYGGESGLYELAVLGQNGHLTYATPITDDVIGYQSANEIRELLRRIAELPAPSEVPS